MSFISPNRYKPSRGIANLISDARLSSIQQNSVSLNSHLNARRVRRDARSICCIRRRRFRRFEASRHNLKGIEFRLKSSPDRNRNHHDHQHTRISAQGSTVGVFGVVVMVHYACLQR